jgi:ABC-type Zn uptake system ZnuABC Zn-binding protein ZnuA/ABC-type Mn2+/Zn2+ transport system ATPase subunit
MEKTSLRIGRIFLCVCCWGVLQTQAQPEPVVASTSVLADLVRAVAGPEVPVQSLLPLGTDPHTFEPLPQTMQMAHHAELIFVNGLTLEGWLEKLIAQSGTQAQVVVLGNSIAPLRHPDHPAATDPHAWMDPLLARQYVRTIRDSLSAWQPTRAATFARNCAAYEDSLLALDTWIATQIARIPQQRRVLITTHDGLRYYTTRYGLQALPLMGTTTDAEVRAGDLRHISGQIAALDVTAVFVEQGINPSLLERLAQEHHIVVAGPLYGDSMSEPDGPAPTYLAMMRHNTRTIVAALSTDKHRHLPPPAATGSGWLLGMAVVLLAGMGGMYWVLRPRKPKLLPTTPWALTVQDLGVCYGQQQVFAGVSMMLAPGKVYGLMGPNGCGKSSLLLALLGQVPASGSVAIGPHPLAHYKGQVAWVPQRAQLDAQFPITVQEVVAMAARQTHISASQLTARVQQALAEVGLQDQGHRTLGELSGGQLQRTLVAQALCQDAAIYLLDEPFAALDAQSSRSLSRCLRGLAAAGKLVMVVHHDLAEAPYLFDEVLLLRGTLMAQGTPLKVLTPERVQQVFGATAHTLPYQTSPTHGL